MAKKRGKILDTAEAWEDGILGADETSAKVSDLIDQDSIDEAVGLQVISIRLQKNVLQDLKAIAKMNNMGYQPLIKNLLQRFVTADDIGGN